MRATGSSAPRRPCSTAARSPARWRGCRTRPAPTCSSSWPTAAASRRRRGGRRDRAVRRYDATRSLGHVTSSQAPAVELPGADGAIAWHLAQALLAAESLGAVEAALEASVAYAKDRFTFGRAIGSYQAVKHELVEILRRLENARSLMYYAGWAAQDRVDEFPLAAAACRTVAGSGARPRRPRADLRARRHRRHVGARRAAVLPARAAVAAAARRRRRRGRPGRGRAVRGGAAGDRRGVARRRAGLDPRPLAVPAPRAPPVPARQVRAAARARDRRRHGGARRGPRGGAGAVGPPDRRPRRGAHRPHPHRRR